MNTKLITRLSAFAIAGAVLAGCSTEQGTNTAVGAAGGAATGAAVGGLLGGGKGAGIGAGAGAVVGGVVGNLWHDVKGLFSSTPNTAGTTVSQQQDGAAKVSLSGDAAFAEGSDRLLPESSTSLDKIVTYLKAHPAATVEARGYTDSKGSARLNRTLSQRRAQAVLNYLTQNGVPPNQVLPARGYGEDDPVADNQTVAGRAANRRVELYLHPNASAAQPSAASQ
jgi:outer membrane protein OmpA-like peptidoglycan-associated protein